MSHKTNKMSHRFRRLGARALAVACALTQMSTPSMAVQAVAPRVAAHQGVNPNLCKINGKLVKPPTSSWTFILNFDHPTSTTVAKGCLADARGGGVTYAAQDCVVINLTTGSSVFGSGNGVFAGNAFLQCDNLPSTPAQPDGFGVRANASFPNPSRTHTLVSSVPMSFTVRTNAACDPILSSRYAGSSFQSSTSGACNVFAEVETRYVKTSSQMNGSHLKNGVPIGTATLTSTLGIPSPFNISIGASGEVFTLDWIMLDPPRSSGDT